MEVTATEEGLTSLGVVAGVALTRTSITGPRRRQLTPREAARLQGLPDAFDFGAQPDALTHKQLAMA